MTVVGSEFGLEHWRNFALKEDPESILLNVDYYSQPNDISCGPTCLRIVHEYYYGSTLYIEGKLPTPSGVNGVSGSRMFEGLESLGLGIVKPSRRIFSRRIRSILKLIDTSVPVIMAFGDSANDVGSHYAVLVGYSKNNLYFHDPFLRPYFPRSRRTFTKMWEKESRWYVGVLPPATAF